MLCKEEIEWDKKVVKLNKDTKKALEANINSKCVNRAVVYWLCKEEIEFVNGKGENEIVKLNKDAKVLILVKVLMLLILRENLKS